MFLFLILKNAKKFEIIQKNILHITFAYDTIYKNSKEVKRWM